MARARAVLGSGVVTCLGSVLLDKPVRSLRHKVVKIGLFGSDLAPAGGGAWVRPVRSIDRFSPRHTAGDTENQSFVLEALPCSLPRPTDELLETALSLLMHCCSRKELGQNHGAASFWKGPPAPPVYSFYSVKRPSLTTFSRQDSF